MIMKPQNNNILIELTTEDTQTTSQGILLSTKEKRVSEKGIVKAVSDKAKKAGYNVGDEVLFKQYALHEVIVDGDTDPLYFVDISLILAIYDDKDEK